ncbi:MAG: cache domain-containing protein [Thermoguttaceae bacterium]
MPHFSRPVLLAVVALTVVVGAAALNSLRTSEGPKQQPVLSDTIDEFFETLTAMRGERKAQIVAYFESARRLADEIVRDPVMVERFFTRLDTRNQLPDPNDDMALDGRFATHYGEFYDILFVDRRGAVFHSVRYESDLGTNIFRGPLSDTKLAKRLREAEEITFIDYEFYPPSDEIGAFFAVPVVDSDRPGGQDRSGAAVGWFVLQCPVNKLRSILSNRQHLGRTGETYLVNTDQRMVTESRFRPGPADMALKVDTVAVAAAIETGTGKQIIDDYRGCRVLSSYEAFEIFGIEWVILAEIDEAEVVTEHFKRHEEFYRAEIVSHLTQNGIKASAPWKRPPNAKIVDMNEFGKATSADTLYTGGVATCTAVAVVLPGRFGYLAHIGPTDRIYGQPDHGHNNCLGEMLNRLQRFDVYPCELSELEFTIVATHTTGFAEAVDLLLGVGIDLSQIRFAYNPKATSANVAVAADDGSVRIQWQSPSAGVIPTTAAHVVDLGSIVKRLAKKNL